MTYLLNLYSTLNHNTKQVGKPSSDINLFYWMHPTYSAGPKSKVSVSVHVGAPNAGEKCHGSISHSTIN